MSFLSITFLVALPLALAPILLHLFDRRRNVTIEWGAMEFLVDAATRRTSARKLKQWLLLALRVLAIAALIFALARPKLPGHWFGSSAQFWLNLQSAYDIRQAEQAAGPEIAMLPRRIVEASE